MKRFLYENSLSLCFLALFVLFIFGQALSGHRIHNEELMQHSRPPLSLKEYVTDAHFGEAVFENWESEFFQMALYVWLAVFFRQKGSAESKPLKEEPEKPYKTKHAPWPVRAGGWVLKLYEHSLMASLFLLFLASFFLHASTGRAEYNEDALLHGQPVETWTQYITGSKFWFESFQNWQSEFLSVAVLILLSIYLREKGSSQSKAVDDPHGKTGD